MSTDDYDVTIATGFVTPGRRRNNFTATAAPTVNDDAGDFYEVGSVWVDVTADLAYMCLDSTLTAAVWQELGEPGASSPATTVESETTFGISPSAGTDTEYARQDHTHGTPNSPASGLDNGTSFPGSPATNDLFWRTDIRSGLLFIYDGTRWISDLLDVMAPIVNQTTDGSTYLLATPSDWAVYVERIEWTTFVVTTNNGTNFWSLALAKLIANNTATSIATTSTSADTASTWTRHGANVDAVLATTDLAVRVAWTKTLSPGGIYADFVLYYRLIAT